jgi:phosphoribosylpyrophosphate synthetase
MSSLSNDQCPLNPREDRGHAQEILRSFCKLRDQKILTDISIKSGNTIVEAHRIVLTAGSAYFRAAFTSHGIFIESDNNKKILNLEHIAEDSLYIYRSH